MDQARGQSAATPQPASPEAVAKLKGKWTAALEEARHTFQATNDRESAEFVATFDGNTVRLYLDGQEKSRSARYPVPLAKNGWDLCIGNSVIRYGTGEFLAYDGLIDEVRIYNRALSATEIKTLATATQAEVDLGPMPSGKIPDNQLAKLHELKDLIAESSAATSEVKGHHN